MSASGEDAVRCFGSTVGRHYRARQVRAEAVPQRQSGAQQSRSKSASVTPPPTSERTRPQGREEPMTFIKMAGIALVTALLFGATASEASACATMDDIVSHADRIAKGLGARYITKTEHNDNGDTVLFLIDSKRASVFWIFDKNGCRKSFSTHMPTDVMAKEVFGKPYADLFPPEAGV